MSTRIVVPAVTALHDRHLPTQHLGGATEPVAFLVIHAGRLLGGGRVAAPPVDGLGACTECWAVVTPGQPNTWRAGDGPWTTVAVLPELAQATRAVMADVARVGHQTAQELTMRQEGVLDAVRALAREVPRG